MIGVRQLEKITRVRRSVRDNNSPFISTDATTAAAAAVHFKQGKMQHKDHIRMYVDRPTLSLMSRVESLKPILFCILSNTTFSEAMNLIIGRCCFVCI